MHRVEAKRPPTSLTRPPHRFSPIDISEDNTTQTLPASIGIVKLRPNHLGWANLHFSSYIAEVGAPKVHVVVQGECLSSIARSYGFEDWTVLYNLPENAELKALRPNPNALVPGDRVAIPERIPFQMDGGIGSWHTIRVKREKPRLRVRLRGIDGEPLANRNYVLEFEDTKRKGSTDGGGLLDEPVPASLSSASVTVEVTDDEPPHTATWKLQVGSLNPAQDVLGAQSRLRNLSLYTGAIDGQRNDLFRLALRSFQTQNELEVTGLLDEPTAQKLSELHDEDA